MPSLSPLINTSPHGLQATAETAPGCPARALTRSPLDTSHTKSSPSSLPPPEASHLPSGLQPTLVTTPRVPPVPAAACHQRRPTQRRSHHRPRQPTASRLGSRPHDGCGSAPYSQPSGGGGGLCSPPPLLPDSSHTSPDGPSGSPTPPPRYR